MSRRTALTGIGAVLATAAIHPVLAKDFSGGAEPVSTLPEDPTTKYPRPPFKGQSQTLARACLENGPAT